MTRHKAVFNWSGGKDSAHALWRAMRSERYEIVALLTTVNRSTLRSTMHGIPTELLRAQADRIGIPLHTVDLTPKGDMEDYSAAMDRAVRRYREEGVTHFISGMAQGVDMYAAEIVLELKKQDPQITLECAIPYERQAAYWSEPLRKRYFSIAERCDQETMLQRQYTPDCLRKRNQYMVDHADIVLAVWNGSPSGTGQTVWYARENGKPVWILRPDTLEVQ